jgi:trk system potassium uptake protein
LASKKAPVLVVGLGRFGYSMAKELNSLGTPILCIDNDQQLVQKCSNEFDRIVVADTTDIDALRELGIEEFEFAVVAIGGDQEASILTTSILSDLGVPKIWAKALSRQHARILKRVGAHHVIQPERETGIRVAHMVAGNLREYLEVAEDWVLVRTTPPLEFVGTPLGQTRLRAKTGVTIVSVKSSASNTYDHADSQTVLAAQDEILIVGKPKAVEEFIALPMP